MRIHNTNRNMKIPLLLAAPEFMPATFVVVSIDQKRKRVVVMGHSV